MARPHTQINIANPQTGLIKKFEFEDEKQLRIFMDKRIGQEVDISTLGEKFKNYIVRITGGNDKDGFPMMLGVATSNRVRLLLDGSLGCYIPLRDGQRRKKTVRGCVVSMDLAVLNVVIVKKGDSEIEGLTDTMVPLRKGPKRASHIRKLFNLTKDDDVRKYVVRRTVERKNAKEGKSTTRSKAPKIQRLVTDLRRAHKRQRNARFLAQRVKTQEAAKKYKAAVARYKLLKAHGHKVVTIKDLEMVWNKKSPKAGKKAPKAQRVVKTQKKGVAKKAVKKH